jgi:hypothetical protein
VALYNPLDADADPFRPPALSTIVHCLHCGEEYDSYRIEWRVLTDGSGRAHGFWCCPIEGCDGCGFGCDIFPIDPEYRDENGDKMWTDDDDEGDDGTDEEPDSSAGSSNGSGRVEPEDGDSLPW